MQLNAKLLLEVIHNLFPSFVYICVCVYHSGVKFHNFINEIK